MRSLIELNRLLAMMDVSVEHVGWRRMNGTFGPSAVASGRVVVCYVSNGEVGIAVDGRAERRCCPGTMALIPAALSASFTMDDDEAEPRLIIGIVQVRLSDSGLLDRVKAPIFADLARSPLVGHAMGELMRLGESGPPALGVGALANSLMKACILKLLQDFFARPGIDLKIIGALADPRLAAVIAAVLERPRELHSIAQMAALAGLSRSTFSRLFGEAMGQAPTEFVAKTRLYYAAELLRTSQAPIKAIAVSVGFSSRSHFSRAFRDAYGLDPTAYRHQQIGERPLPVPQDLRDMAEKRTAG